VIRRWQNSTEKQAVHCRARASRHAFALILAGGSGTRFWPLSRRLQPKQLLRFFGQESLLQQAARRIQGLIPPERTYVLTNAAILESVRRQLPDIPSGQIVGEPASRNTAPAIGLAAHEIARCDPEGIMVVLPSDHVITRQGVFRRMLLYGCEQASRAGRSIVIGIKPTRAETGYGYIRLGMQEGGSRGIGIFRVAEFTEKPSTAAARRYFRSGKYLWNGGMFIWSVATLIANFERYQPTMAAAIRRMSLDGGMRSPKALKALYPRLENISIDYALMEKIQDVHAVAADIGWSDLGSWLTAFELSRKDPQGNVCPPRGFLLDCRDNMIVSEKKFTAAVGVRNLVIVETDDALLVCSKDRSQDVGRIVRELERRNVQELL
jgi:mannose-1-phosphate guanylyltransferase/mannose-6-phosphate isomerase